MTTLVDQDFTSGIPSGFATAQGNGGTLAVAYNSGQSSADLTPQSNVWQAWSFDAVAAQASLSVEIDVEMITAGDYFGVGLVPSIGGAQGVYQLIAPLLPVFNGGSFGTTPYAPQTDLGDMITQGAMLSLMTTNRAKFRVESYVSSGTRKTVSYRDDQLANIVVNAQIGTLRPMVSLYNGAWRIRHVKITDTPTNVDSSLLTQVRLGSFTDNIGMVGLPEQRAATALNLPRPVWVYRSAGYHSLSGLKPPDGTGYISGTTDVLALPDNLPYGAKVRLIVDRTGLMVEEQITDPLTGAYRFDGLSKDFKFTVLAIDTAHNYRAVVADNITPS